MRIAILIAALTSLAPLAAAAQSPIAMPIAIDRPQRLGGNIPLVTLTINGISGTFLLDTGATATVVSRDFAARAGLKPTGDAGGHDSAGTQTQGQTLEPGRLSLPGASGGVEAFGLMAMDIPALAPLGVSGVFSPQSLAGDGCVNIDFKGNTVTYATAGAPACRVDGMALVDHSSLRRPTVTLRIVETGRTVTLVLDSGAGRTVLPGDAGDGLPALDAGTSRSVTGTATAMQAVGPVTLMIGSHPVRLARAAIAAGAKTPVLGMDALGAARIVLGADGTVALDF